MRRYSELSRDAERSSAHQFFPDCTIAMRGYDFRERHQAIAVGELDPTVDLPLQHDQLLPERGILGLKSAPGFEGRSNQVQE
jgi:hypothetical protein